MTQNQTCYALHFHLSDLSSSLPPQLHIFLCLSPLGPGFPTCQYKARKKSSELYLKSHLSNRNWDIACRVAKFKKLSTQLTRCVSDKFFHISNLWNYVDMSKTRLWFFFLKLAKWRHPMWGEKKKPNPTKLAV